MEDRNFLTSEEVCKLWGISAYTLHNYRRGYYYGYDKVGKKKNKVYKYLPSGEGIPRYWNVDERRFEYNPVKIAVWIRQVNKMKEGV